MRRILNGAGCAMNQVKQLDPDFDVVGSALPYFKMYAPHSGLAKL